ncbi:hypothetical protein [Pseudomonas sp. MWU13-2105]|uniref:hypothetical protein n=1 Tax=Pseudomonas sp. MWU13-2105 TaxID=2935074 RepID=UPI00200F0CC6|nr:hypothetical protein [Pseudomonas sp. MWU13-2105]
MSELTHQSRKTPDNPGTASVRQRQGAAVLQDNRAASVQAKPTMQMKVGVNINDDEGLEREADVMGARAKHQSIAQGKLQGGEEHIAQLQRFDAVVGAPIQLENKLSMHVSPSDTRKAGRLGIDTGAQVRALIATGVLQDLKHSRIALNESIQVREAEPNPDVGHADRIVREKAWLAQLDVAIAPLEIARQAENRNPISKPPPPSGPGWQKPVGNVWGHG